MQPLDDMTVLELGRLNAPLNIRLAMAMAGRLTADQGARVVRTTVPDGDPLSALPPLLPDGASAVDRFLNRGKQSVGCADDDAADRVIDVLSSDGLAAALVAEGDPARPRLEEAGIPIVTLATWPADVEKRQGEAPVNGFGVMAASGILDIVGEPDREQLRLGGHQISYAAGLSAFTAMTAAIAQRDRDGRALHARVSLIETAAWMNWKAVVGAARGSAYPTRMGDKADFTVLRCRDG